MPKLVASNLTPDEFDRLRVADRNTAVIPGHHDKKTFSEQLLGCLRFYFLEGQFTRQMLDSKGQIGPRPTSPRPSATFVGRHRRLLALIIPIIIVHTVWWAYMTSTDQFGLFTGKIGANEMPRWYMSVTMVFGSMVAGATSEGGASVAFPIMTLVFGISPVIARDFSFMIQSVGMTAASFTIVFMNVLVEWRAVVFVTLGGAAGIIFGLEYCVLDPPYAKMYFVVIWGAFAASLYWLNRVHGRKVYLVLDPPHLPAIWANATLWSLAKEGPLSYVAFNWKATVLIATGFLGGIFSSISGSGIDICSFACLTLLFRVSEKTATPTSVVLMAINTVVGFLYRNYGQGGVEREAWSILLVCAPIVCFGAPLGSFIGSFVHRLVLAWAIYITDSVQLIAAIIIVKPWLSLPTPPGHDTPVHLTASSAAIFVSGLVFFYILQRAGEKLVESNTRTEAKYVIPAIELEAAAEAVTSSRAKAQGSPV